MSSTDETPPPHLFLVLVDVKVELTERAQCVELVAMETGLFHQVGVHVLITDAGHFGNIPVVPAGHIHTVVAYNFNIYLLYQQAYVLL